MTRLIFTQQQYSLIVWNLQLHPICSAVLTKVVTVLSFTIWDDMCPVYMFVLRYGSCTGPMRWLHLAMYHMKSHLSIQVVSKTVDKLGLNGILLSQQWQVMCQFVVRRDNGSMSKRVILRSASAAKDLHHVEYSEINKGTLLGIVDLCSLKQSHDGK